MNRVLIVKASNCKYTDDDVLEIYNCIKKIGKCEFFASKNSYLLKIILESLENKFVEFINFDEYTDTGDIYNFAIKNNINFVVLLGIGNNKVISYNLTFHNSNIRLYFFSTLRLYGSYLF